MILPANLIGPANIISEAEAYEQLKAGKFILNYFPDALYSIGIKNVELVYMLDLKGYYQPVYSFHCAYGMTERVQGGESKQIYNLGRHIFLS